jgi:hypothetical protein
LQIMMVPVDGKNFFANDVFRSAFSGVGSGSAASDDGSDDPAATAIAAKAQKRSTRRP